MTETVKDYDYQAHHEFVIEVRHNVAGAFAIVSWYNTGVQPNRLGLKLANHIRA